MICISVLAYNEAQMFDLYNQIGCESAAEVQL